jgi:hypothetical protein
LILSAKWLKILAIKTLKHFSTFNLYQIVH